MFSRMLHDTKGNMSAVPYGKKSQCILSIDRRYLNELLLNEAEKYPNVKMFFNHKLIKCDINSGELELENMETNQVVKTKMDLIVGADGSYSNVRASLLKSKSVDYSQSYACGCYMELRIPPNKDKQFALPPKHLHIWPRGDFMLIALPNQDCSFTCTLFMPLKMFDQLNTPNLVLEFFEKYFIDALDLIGR
jgi:kynurenine 3-monooxygenase